MPAQKLDEEVIFNVARKINPSEVRAEYLQHICGDDEPLLARVQALLLVHEQDRDFLACPLTRSRATQGPALEPPAVSESSGTVIGPYKLLEQIGEGGFGVVFMAEQHHPVRRKVALKVLKPGMDTRQIVGRFEAERQALALMDHPNIAHVFDGGETTSGRPYFVMELVRGIPVTEFCDQNQLTIRERLELFISICQAVQHAHQKGVIHRDLKPSNVMVTMHDSTPVVKVIDFGIAKATGQQLTDKTLFTNFAQLIGTPVYMSPEQAQMNGLDIDTRSDIYSLGVLLYELLTGTTPIDKERLGTAAYDEMRRIIGEVEPAIPSTQISRLGPSAPTVSANRHSDPKRLVQLVRGELDWIVMKALEKDRNRRYETATAFAADVQRYLHDETVLACPPTLGYRLRKIVWRHKGPVWAATLVLLALVGGIVGTTWGLIRAKQSQAVAVRAAVQKDEALVHKELALAAAGQSEREKTEQLWQALVAQAQANRTSRRSGQRFKTLEILLRATQLACDLDLPEEKFHELKNDVVATLALPDLYLGGPEIYWPADSYEFDIDDAHTVYARTDLQGNCSIRRVADDVELHRLPGLGAPAMPRLSRDATFIAIRHLDSSGQSGVAMHVWQLDGSPPRQILSEPNAHWPDFRASQQIALAYQDGAICLFDLPSGRRLRTLAPDTITREVCFAIHPTEPVFATWSYFEPVVQLRDLETGKVLASSPQPARAVGLGWHPNGHTIAVGYENAPIRLLDRATLEPYRTLETVPTSGTSVVFNHAGDRLVTRDWSNIVALFDVGTGRQLFAIPAMPGARRFSSDDRRLAGGVVDNQIGIWQVADGREHRTLVHSAMREKDEYVQAAVSADGRLLAVAMKSGFGLWDLASGSELAFIPPAGSVNRVRFEPTGALLTLSNSGLSRWPVGSKLKDRDNLVIGPPEPLPLPIGHDLNQSSNGQVIVTCDRTVGRMEPYAGGWILHTDRLGQPIRLDPGADIAGIAVSPDGRWVVTVTHATGMVKIWHAHDGRLEKELANWGTGSTRFSPDGRWLATNLDGGRLLSVENWEPGPRVGRGAVFAPDSNLLAVPTTTGIHLVDHVTGREVAMLENPNLEITRQPLFTPDGTKLIALTGTGGIHVWDLRLIRQQLKAMGLDWNWPEFPPDASRSMQQSSSGDGRVTHAAPLKVKVLSGNSDHSALTREEKARQSIEQCRRAVEADPESANACNNLAWAYLTAPDELREVDAALPLAEKAVQMAGSARERAMFRNTLGIAYYRAGRFREAVETLRPNLSAQEDVGLAFDLYFLAMSYYQLGELERAHDYFEWAVRWTKTQTNISAGHSEELAEFRAEAEKLLGLNE